VGFLVVRPQYDDNLCVDLNNALGVAFHNNKFCLRYDKMKRNNVIGDVLK